MGDAGPLGECSGDDADCSEALRELYTFIDAELTVESRLVIQGHLDGCDHCLEVFDFEAELRAVIARKCTEQVPESLRRRIGEALARAEASELADGAAPGA